MITSEQMRRVTTLLVGYYQFLSVRIKDHVNDNGDDMNTKEEVDIFQTVVGDEVVSNHIKISDMENNLTNIPDDVLMQLLEEVDNQQCTDVDLMFISPVASAE